MLIKFNPNTYLAKNKNISITNIKQIDDHTCCVLELSKKDHTLPSRVTITLSEAWVVKGSRLATFLGKGEAMYFPLLKITTEYEDKAENTEEDFGLFGYTGKGLDVMSYVLGQNRRHYRVIENALSNHLARMDQDTTRLRVLDNKTMHEPTGLEIACSRNI